ncbi:phosphoribosylamine--glycine ligase [Oricola cellulosilytica]|uniref:Phosphoribosylamine--glycine ligase n=1 Tax=Oricola cellulosilytica TaxID=1429082 RepID=A0A4R0PBV9_9HYPH|nr:phosphoribosylamine--glycine ligase [Oricola cellulosilytica]TCD13427.1 phosphoribosylamine--glycine ligase [Oricola cellulosilytica]
MKVLLIGSGGREHALADKLASSPILETLYCAPGNPGMAELGECVVMKVTDHKAIIDFCRINAINLVVVGPEAPLVDGLTDTLNAANIPVFGPSAAAAQLEGSKRFTKELCDRMDIPTARYAVFSNAPKAKKHIRQHGAPVVIKADGLAAGKGVTVATTLDQAMNAIDDCFEGAHGAAGAEVVIEECLIGEEASFFCICDGETALPLTSAQDHKRVGDGDTGPNTGGMGAYSPASILTDQLASDVMKRIIEPTMRGMAEAGTPFTGILYAGLMLTDDGPKLIEYNVRFGDPECQVIMPRLKDDLLLLMKAAIDGLLDQMSARWHDQAAATVVMCAPGYPISPEKGSVIRNIERAGNIGAVTIYHAGTAWRGEDLVANGGRVLNVTATGRTVTDAVERAYEAIREIDWPDGFYRKDIGWREIQREKSAKA